MAIKSISTVGDFSAAAAKALSEFQLGVFAVVILLPSILQTVGRQLNGLKNVFQLTLQFTYALVNGWAIMLLVLAPAGAAPAPFSKVVLEHYQKRNDGQYEWLGAHVLYKLPLKSSVECTRRTYCQKKDEGMDLP